MNELISQKKVQESKKRKVLRCGYAAAAAATAKSLQTCLTLCDPIDGSPPGSLHLGFSRQEHWSGLPFPSPMHESDKPKWSRSVVSDSLHLHGLQPTRLLHPWDFPGQSTAVGCHCLLWQLGRCAAKETSSTPACLICLSSCLTPLVGWFQQWRVSSLTAAEAATSIFPTLYPKSSYTM